MLPPDFFQNPTLWLSLDPTTHFKVNWTPGPNFGSQGPLAPNSKICNFLTNPNNMGVYGLAWTPGIFYEVFCTPGPNFGSKAQLAPNLKIGNFLTKVRELKPFSQM